MFLLYFILFKISLQYLVKTMLLPASVNTDFLFNEFHFLAFLRLFLYAYYINILTSYLATSESSYDEHFLHHYVNSY